VVPEASFERRVGHARLLFPSVPLPLFNGVLVESEPWAGVAESVREVEAHGMPCGMQVREGTHARADAEATRLGLTARTPMPGMVASAADLADARVDGLEIAPAADMATLGEAALVCAAGFGAPVEAIRPLYSPAVLAADGLAVYVGRVAGEAVTTAIGYRTGREVAVFSVGTPPQHRRRGFGGAISAHAVRAGFEQGADLAWLQTSGLGEPVYRKLGFRHAVMHALLTRPPAS
jgi:ribosomal protein S18 acetylase RimI-like enzyme